MLENNHINCIGENMLKNIILAILFIIALIIVLVIVFKLIHALFPVIIFAGAAYGGYLLYKYIKNSVEKR